MFLRAENKIYLTPLSSLWQNQNEHLRSQILSTICSQFIYSILCSLTAPLIFFTFYAPYSGAFVRSSLFS